MEHSHIVLILESIPEAFMLISLGLALYGYNIKKKIKYIIIAAIVEAFLTYITRNIIDEYQARTLINTIILFLVILAIRIEPIKAFLASFTSILILLLSETMLVMIIKSLSNQPLEDILENVWLQILLPWPHIILLIGIAFYISERNISLLKVEDKLKNIHINKKSAPIYLATLILFLAVILGIINVGSISGENYLGKFLHGNGIFILTFLIALDIYLMYGVITRLFKVNENESLIQAQETYLKNLEEIMNTLTTQRHDFINHVEVLYSLHAEKKYEETKIYLEKIIGDISQINSIVRLDNPPLGALLNTKMMIAEAKGINMELSVETSLKNLPIDSFVLVKILGNLIDNAFDAVLESKEKYIEVEIERLSNNYVINVKNTGMLIKKKNMEHIFEKGFTTKGENHEGWGLASVKEIVKRYGGEIKVKSDEEEGTTFTTILPEQRM